MHACMAKQIDVNDDNVGDFLVYRSMEIIFIENILIHKFIQVKRKKGGR